LDERSLSAAWSAWGALWVWGSGVFIGPAAPTTGDGLSFEDVDWASNVPGTAARPIATIMKAVRIEFSWPDGAGSGR
jgi:hypothetical protein